MRGQPDSKSSRFVSRITRETLALVLAGGRGTRLKMLTDWRAKPAVPFGGKFRIIDFSLSNAVNSGIRRISVLTQYKSHSLIRHLQLGWNRIGHGMDQYVELIPAQQWLAEDSWFVGTADAVYQSLDIIASHNPRYVLILAGDHVYKMDYGEMLAAHVDRQAELTVACLAVPRSDAHELGVMSVDGESRVTEFNEKPDQPATLPDDPESSLASMGIYIFSFDYLIEALRRDATDQNSAHDFGKNVIPTALDQGDAVFAYPFADQSSIDAVYWRDVGTIDAYYEANCELTGVEPGLDLYDPAWPIWTHQSQLPPARFIGERDRDFLFGSTDRIALARRAKVNFCAVMRGSRLGEQRDQQGRAGVSEVDALGYSLG